jgi:geranylgeranylglycerol-phosphate geranylgeranyltransferase
MNSKLKAYFAITRPVNLNLCAFSILVGAVISGSIHPLYKVLLACLSGVFIMAGGNVINDYYDVQIDRVNKPQRPLPQELLKLQSALKFSIILFVLGIFLSIFINLSALGLVLLTSAGLILYSSRFKGSVLLGNLLVSLFSALAFIYGGLAVGRWRQALIPAGFAFLFHLGREIIKDVEDQKADAAYSTQTLPIRFGQNVALGSATLVYGLLIVFTMLPYVLDIYGKGYFWIVLLGVDLVIIVGVGYIWARPLPQTFSRVSMVLKVDMFVGLMAIYVGNVG